MHPALPGRDTGSQGHPNTQACAQLGELELALPISPAQLMCCAGSYYGLWLGRWGVLWIQLRVGPRPRPWSWPRPWPWHWLLVAWDQRRNTGLAMQDFLGKEEGGRSSFPLPLHKGYYPCPPNPR